MAFFSTRSGQFAYFARQLGLRDWGGLDVLDFGGNVGNILRDPESTIDVGRYWCMDVIREAIGSSRSKRERQCLDGKLVQLQGTHAAAVEAQGALVDALRKGEDARAQQLLDRVTQARRLADQIYVEAQRCVDIGG